MDYRVRRILRKLGLGGLPGVSRIRVRPEDFVFLDHERVSGAGFGRRKLLQFCAVGSRLDSCSFDGATIEDGAFGSGKETSEYIDCTFDDAKITHGGGDARFVRCSFRNVELQDWFCFGTQFINCTFSGRLRKGIFDSRRPIDGEWIASDSYVFDGNDFSAMEFVDVGFRGVIDLTRQRLPSGPEYLYITDAAGAVGAVRREVIGWPDLEMRRFAMLFVKQMEDDIRSGQRQLFFRPADFKGADSRCVFELLRAYSQA